MTTRKSYLLSMIWICVNSEKNMEKKSESPYSADKMNTVNLKENIMFHIFAEEESLRILM